MASNSQPFPVSTRDSTISLQETTEDNWRTVANLKPTSVQARNLASNPMSMLEAHYSEDAWMRAVCADDIMVGFLMMALWPPTDGYYIWCFMIDERYQGLGFGRRAVHLAIDHVRTTYSEARKLGACPHQRRAMKGKG